MNSLSFPRGGEMGPPYVVEWFGLDRNRGFTIIKEDGEPWKWMLETYKLCGKIFRIHHYFLIFWITKSIWLLSKMAEIIKKSQKTGKSKKPKNIWSESYSKDILGNLRMVGQCYQVTKAHLQWLVLVWAQYKLWVVFYWHTPKTIIGKWPNFPPYPF